MKTYFKTGEPFVLLTGAGLAVILVMTMTLITVVMTNGLGYFWPRELVRYELADGSAALGQLMVSEKNPVSGARRIQLKVSNRDVFGQDFRWIDEKDIATRSVPSDAVLVERKEHGNFAGFLTSVSGRLENRLAAQLGSPANRIWRTRSRDRHR